MTAIAQLPRCRHPELDVQTDALSKHGYCVLRDIVPSATMTALAGDLAPHFDNAPFCVGGFYGERTKRFGGLLRRSPHMRHLVQHEWILHLAREVLGPWCDTIQLNLTQAIEIQPGGLSQVPHRDQDMWRGDVGEKEYLINVMWPLTDYTAQNGATLIWPDSHGSNALKEEVSNDPVIPEATAGSAVIFLGSTLHGAGANRSTLPRRGILISYSLGWLKPYENQWLVYPPAVAKTFDRPLSELIGYVQHRPNLGNFEGQCPSVLFDENRRQNLAATDALRPDQVSLLSAFMAEQTKQAAESTPRM